MRKIIILLFLIINLSSCSIDWNWEKDKRITELEKQFAELKKNNFSKNIIPETSFKTHLIQFWWLHSSLYDGVFWEISSLDEPYPMNDSLISDIKNLWINVDYRWRKDYFEIWCPKWFQITNCEINNLSVESIENKCYLYFPQEWNNNSDISFICNNGKLSTPLY